MQGSISVGGPKILDHCREALDISDAQTTHAREVFRAFGSMSSATVPDVLMNLARDADVEEGTLVVALGFGPGLTATGAVLQKLAA